MKEVWYLIITLFVLEPDGTIDERQLYSTRQIDRVHCQLEANARIDMFTRYIGKDHIRRFSTTAQHCTLTVCQDDEGDGTYRIGLSGVLVGFQVGCQNRPELVGERIPLPETGIIENERKGIRSFP